MKFLQKLGKALMVPVAVLPAAGLLMGIAYACQSFGGSIPAMVTIGTFLMKIGGAIIDNMALLFAIGVAFGMSKGNSGAAAMSGFVGFMIVVGLLTPAGTTVLGFEVSASKALALSKINNPLTGILTGIITSFLYNKFHKTMLPQYLAFFNGKRLVPMVTAGVMALFAIVMFFVWPVFFGALVAFGQFLVDLGGIGAAIFGFFNRLLIPTGLHHALNNIFWFDTIGIGDLTGWLAGKGTVGVTGMYQAGFFPIMMFGLPGACLAFVHTAKPENRAKIAGVMGTAALTSFVVGITEPIEFAFMFVAPVLYVVHAALTALSMGLAVLFKATAGFGFSAGIVDYVLSLANPLKSNIWVLPVMGIVFFAVYYFLFKFLIVKFDMKTPGREDEDAE